MWIIHMIVRVPYFMTSNNVELLLHLTGAFPDEPVSAGDKWNGFLQAGCASLTHPSVSKHWREHKTIGLASSFFIHHQTADGKGCCCLYFGSVMRVPVFCRTHTLNHFTSLVPGLSGWAGARRNLLDFMVQRKITEADTDNPAAPLRPD